MFESEVEKYLVKRVIAAGGKVRKVVYQGRNGAPDRWCFFPGPKLIIVEVKRPEGELSKQQKTEIKELRSVDQDVRIVWNKDQVDDIFGR